MKLYLARHGEAMSKDENPDRPLTDSGSQTVRQIAAFLENSGTLAVSEVRHSTKLRARQTAELMAQHQGDEVQINQVEGLEPMADVRPLAHELATVRTDLMLVGHLPHLDRLASRLVAGDAEKGAFDFEAGGVLCLQRRDENGRPSWTVEWMLDPHLVID